MALAEDQRQALVARVRYLRELGIYDLYRRPVSDSTLPLATAAPENVTDAVQITTAAEEPDIARTPAVISIINELPVQPFSGDKATALQALKDHIGWCMRCPLSQLGRQTVVFADGDPDAEMMFVGEGPGADEDASGLPFVGRAGQLLNNMISAMGKQRSEVFIANVVKCRPPNNRDPEPIEANTCLPFLAQQIDIVQPKVVIALGRIATQYLTGTKLSLGSHRGRLQDFRGRKLLVTYHPAFLLRDPRQKKEAWADLQVAMQYLGWKAPKKEA